MQNHADPIKSQPNESEKSVVVRSLIADTIKVVVLDYHNLYLNGFCTVLNLIGFNVIGKAQKGMELIRFLATQEQPDILIINYKTTRPKTLIVVKVVKRKYPFIKVIVNTQYTSKLLLNELEIIGVEGFIMKTYDKEQITNTLLTIYNS
jgi:DNA-binding NarL/FixJ family response regulator